MYLLFKLLHIFFMMAWFAGLFYLPRLFVNLAQVADGGAEYQRLCDMARRLFRFMTPLGIGALIFGIATATAAGWWSQTWLHGKAFLALLLLIYHGLCYRLLLDFLHGYNRRSAKWYRFFNELPVLVLAAALFLVVYKPF